VEWYLYQVPWNPSIRRKATGRAPHTHTHTHTRARARAGVGNYWRFYFVILIK